MEKCESDPATASIANNRSRTTIITKKQERERERGAGSVGRNVGGDGEETDVKAPAATLRRKGEKEDGVGEEDGG